MGDKRLNIIAIDQNRDPQNKSKFYGSTKARRLENQAYFDRIWLIDPEHFDPTRNCMEIERLNRTMRLLEEYRNLKDKNVTDLGCGSGVLSRRMRDAGGTVTSVDISSNALKILKKNDTTNIHPVQDYVPKTSLKDDSYDLVVCTELIAHLPPDEYRLLFSELTRLVKADGYIICSSSMDIDSTDALQRFADMAETEIQIDRWILSWHRLYIRIKDFFTAPSRFVRASKDHEYRLHELKSRYGVSRWWFRINSTSLPAGFWFLFQYVFKPFVLLLKKNRSVLLFLEKICKFIWSEFGISHAIFIGKRRPLFEKLPSDEIPREIKHKKQVWE